MRTMPEYGAAAPLLMLSVPGTDGICALYNVLGARTGKRLRGDIMTPNVNYTKLKESYLFRHIAERVDEYLAKNPGKKLYRMGIGDVSLPLAPAVIEALHEAVCDQAKKATFHGYMPETGDPELRELVRRQYASRGVELRPGEVFISSGASDELGDILDLFGPGQVTMIMEPAYPAYVDANLMTGNTVVHVPAGRENGFLPSPADGEKALAESGLTQPDLIYICSPNNPTGAVFGRDRLAGWVAWAKERDAVIIFDAAYEAFIEEDLPHSIFEIPGAGECAIEICSLSKTAGFTGTRLGYTVIPETLVRAGLSLNSMWVRNRTTKTNGVSYILQKGARAVFTEEGQKQIHANIEIYKENGRVLTEAMDELGLWYTGGKNAPYIWFSCPGGDSWAFFDRMLNEIQVVGTPGEGFGACGEGYFRFSCFGSPEDTRAAAGRLREMLR